MIQAIGILLAGAGLGMIYAGAADKPFLAPITEAFGFTLPSSSSSSSSSTDGKNQGAVIPRPASKTMTDPFPR